MLNQKSLLNFVYAIAFVGAVMSCFGILNELLNILQLRGVLIHNVVNIKEEAFREPFLFYLFAFLISAATVVFLILYLFGRINRIAMNIILGVACVGLLVLSFVFIVVLRETSEDKVYYLYLIEYFDYMTYYTFRSGMMSFVANAAILLGCNLVDGTYKKRTKDQGGESCS